MFKFWFEYIEKHWTFVICWIVVISQSWLVSCVFEQGTTYYTDVNSAEGRNLMQWIIKTALSEARAEKLSLLRSCSSALTRIEMWWKGSLQKPLKALNPSVTSSCTIEEVQVCKKVRRSPSKLYWLPNLLPRWWLSNLLWIQFTSMLKSECISD